MFLLNTLPSPIERDIAKKRIKFNKVTLLASAHRRYAIFQLDTPGINSHTTVAAGLSTYLQLRVAKVFFQKSIKCKLVVILLQSPSPIAQTYIPSRFWYIIFNDKAIYKVK